MESIASGHTDTWSQVHGTILLINNYKKLRFEDTFSRPYNPYIFTSLYYIPTSKLCSRFNFQASHYLLFNIKKNRTNTYASYLLFHHLPPGPGIIDIPK